VFSFSINVDSYRYYAVGTSYPLLQTVTSTVDFMGSAETFQFAQWMGDLTTAVPAARELADQPVLQPNPAQGTTQLLLPEAFRKEVFITLSDATGRTVKQYFLMDDGDGRSFIDLAGMTTGQYFVTVENEKGQRTTVRLNVL
ncbi:MAG TPA: T9SS type A sorting domain-containing protein, partial [Flavobacteriales bacterium]|nr:T9SS type A sorting domain-containing protein [Flavobacteriales bacterium]